MDKWRSVAIINLLILSSTFLYLRETNKENFNVEDFVEPIDCIDDGFDLSAYLKISQSKTESPLVHFWYEKMYDKVGRAHQFMSVGEGWGESCLRNENGAGCAPFKLIIEKFRQLEGCLENIPTDGEWMNKTTVDGHFNDVKYSDVEKLITRLAMLANKPDQDWKRSSLLEKMTSKPDQVAKCVREITRNQLKCLPVLFGAPGFDGLTLQDHHLHGKFEQHRFLSHDCQIAPVCSRLAAQRLYHFQTMFFQPNYLKGGWRSSINLNRNDIWVSVDGKLRNQGCEIDPARFGGVLCWQYTKCARLIMSQLCSQYEQCCPSLKVHQECRQGLKCKVCQKSS